ncbi:MAG: hypothetical protein DMF69_17375 [Acidobacteria bacterium]|nr:MAG: hypothetical protein DMF69_17375 [Acidobacteriota bacterium]
MAEKELNEAAEPKSMGVLPGLITALQFVETQFRKLAFDFGSHKPRIEIITFGDQPTLKYTVTILMPLDISADHLAAPDCGIAPENPESSPSSFSSLANISR